MKVYSFYTILALVLCTACTRVSQTQDAGKAAGSPDSLKSGQLTGAEPAEHTMQDLLADLQKMEWRLARVHVDTTVAESDEKTFTLIFKESSFSARFCNRTGGGYTLQPGNKVRFEKVISTQMYCGVPEYLMPAENFIKDGVYDIDITKGYLTLAKGRDSLVFSRKSTPEENPMAN